MVQFCYLRLYLGIETVSRRLLRRMARMDMDWNMKKLGQLFQVFMLSLQKKHHKMFDIYFTSQTEHFFVWVKALSDDFGTELT